MVGIGCLRKLFRSSLFSSGFSSFSMLFLVFQWFFYGSFYVSYGFSLRIRVKSALLGGDLGPGCDLGGSGAGSLGPGHGQGG